MDAADPAIVVEGLTLAYGSFVVQRGLSFAIERGEIFVVMGDSGCGKSTLLRHMVGLLRPFAGRVLIEGRDPWSDDHVERAAARSGLGVMYQQGALWSSMTLAENIDLPLGEYTELAASERRELASYKLALVGLAGFEDHLPSEVSGGMRKRAALARAMALDPTVLFVDEPSAGLDPISARLLDDLILELRDSLRATIVIVTHELASIFAVADRAVFLDAVERTSTAIGRPQDLLAEPPNEKVGRFLRRGATPS
ncbi:MAG TPA: ATP-binding cassette domain-containing protein [Planctomycetota bacterium]|nr:ATP-binding cassette domain-containing protein [Planctomycetota bacterium]